MVTSTSTTIESDDRTNLARLRIDVDHVVDRLAYVQTSLDRLEHRIEHLVFGVDDNDNYYRQKNVDNFRAPITINDSQRVGRQNDNNNKQIPATSIDICIDLLYRDACQTLTESVVGELISSLRTNSAKISNCLSSSVNIRCTTEANQTNRSKECDVSPIQQQQQQWSTNGDQRNGTATNTQNSNGIKMASSSSSSSSSANNSAPEKISSTVRSSTTLPHQQLRQQQLAVNKSQIWKKFGLEKNGKANTAPTITPTNNSTNASRAQSRKTLNDTKSNITSTTTTTTTTTTNNNNNKNERFWQHNHQQPFAQQNVERSPRSRFVHHPKVIGSKATQLHGSAKKISAIKNERKKALHQPVQLPAPIPPPPPPPPPPSPLSSSIKVEVKPYVILSGGGDSSSGSKNCTTSLSPPLPPQQQQQHQVKMTNLTINNMVKNNLDHDANYDRERERSPSSTSSLSIDRMSFASRRNMWELRSNQIFDSKNLHQRQILN